MRKLILLLAVAITANMLYAQGDRKTTWDTDLDFLLKELPARHFNLFSVQSRNVFKTGISTIKAEVGNLTDFQVGVKVQQLIAKFGDSHTMLNINDLIDRSQKLPFEVEWFSDGLYIVKAAAENESLLGRLLLNVNGKPIAAVVDSLSTLVTVDNKAVVKVMIPLLFSSTQLLEHFNFLKGNEVVVDLKSSENGIESVKLLLSAKSEAKRLSFKPDSLAYSTWRQKTLFCDSLFRNEKLYYILYNKCSGREVAINTGNWDGADRLPSFEEFERKVLTILKEKSFDKLVFDLRNNSGGSSRQGTMLIEKIAKFLEQNPQVTAYVVVGRQTFSSAILNAMDFKRMTKAVFVGEETAGKPNHFGEVRSLTLPNSQVDVSYSTKYFKNIDKDMATITPDITLEVSFENYKQGVDPIFEWIRRQSRSGVVL